VFLLAKSERYFYDAIAIAEASQNDGRRTGRHRYVRKPHCDTPDQQENFAHVGETRNCRNLWTIATTRVSGAHFATFPLELAERCVLAGTSGRGCCAACGEPWVRQDAGWTPSCRCNADVVPCTVLDMFGGTGTSAHAALKHGRDAILIELNADYIRLTEQRLAVYLHPAVKLAAD